MKRPVSKDLQKKLDEKFGPPPETKIEPSISGFSREQENSRDECVRYETYEGRIYCQRADGTWILVG